MTAPCPTCRQEVVHIERLRQEIEALRPKARLHRGFRVEYFRNIAARRKAKKRHAQNRCEHRTAIRDLAQHLTDHAEEAAA